MKVTKILAVAAVLAMSAAAFVSCASSSAAPDWYSNKDAAYPESKYISGLGSGSSVDAAKANAMAELSRYLQSSIQSTLTTEFVDIKTGDSSMLTERVQEENFITSSLSMSGLKYTDPYKKGSEYFVVAYIDRGSAWKQVDEKLKVAQSGFYSFMDKADGESPLRQYYWYKKAQDVSADYLGQLLIANFINSTMERQTYGEDHKLISSLPSLMADCIARSTLYLDLKNDSGNVITNELNAVFKKIGFTVSRQKSAAAYVVNAVVDLNEETQGDMFIAYPSLELTIDYDNDTFYAYSAKISDKTVAYNHDRLVRDALKKLVAVIDSELADDFNAKVSD